jgi:two-component system nitrogen regulation response regulator NtrX
LRQHREDIPDLCDFFMQRAAEAAGVPSRRISEDAIATLQAYDWPGNARQLRNVVDWIVIMAPGHPEAPVGPDHLPAEVGIYTPTSLHGQRNESRGAGGAGSFAGRGRYIHAHLASRTT